MDFVESVRRTATLGSKLETLQHCCLGIGGESGEILELIKKHIYYGKPYTKEELKNEIGDVLFYLQWLSDVHGFSVYDAMSANMEKLLKRYPSGFNSTDALLRKDTEKE